MNPLVTLFVAAVLTVTTTDYATGKCAACDAECDACSAPASCCRAPQCQTAGRCCGGPKCVGKAEMVDVEKHCWKVECEEICIPAVRFPWERGGSKLTLCSLFNCKKGCGKSGCCDSGCDGGCAAAPTCGCDGDCAKCLPAKCGFVRTVRHLKKESVAVQACKYSMEVGDKKPSGECCDGRNCGGCDDCATQAAAGQISARAAANYQHQAQPQTRPVPAETDFYRQHQAPVMTPVNNQVPAAPVPQPSARNSLSQKVRLLGQKSRTSKIFAVLTGAGK